MRFIRAISGPIQYYLLRQSHLPCHHSSKSLSSGLSVVRYSHTLDKFQARTHACTKHDHFQVENSIKQSDNSSTTQEKMADNDFDLTKTQAKIASIYNTTTGHNIFSMYATGGGVSLSSWLLTVPGASNSVMNIQLPYSRHATLDLLDHYRVLEKSRADNDQLSFCSNDMALYLAEAAYRDAIEASLSLTNHFSTSSTSSSSVSTSSMKAGAVSSSIATSDSSSCETNMLQEKTEGNKQNSTSIPQPHNHNHYNIFGVACTAALVSGTPKKGAHRCHIAIASGRAITSYTLTLDKQLGRSRCQEDNLCSQLLLHAIQEQSVLSPHIKIAVTDATSISEDAAFSFLAASDQLAIHRDISRNLLADVCSKHCRHVLFFPPSSDSTSRSVYDWIHAADVQVPAGSIIFPGSFNPVHEGHIDLVLAAIQTAAKSSSSAKVIAKPPLVIFEIAAVNADKPAIALDILETRIGQFNAQTNPLLRKLTTLNIPYAVAITSEPFFSQKAAIFQQCTFVIGADTLERLFNIKYYLPKPSNNEATTNTNTAASATLGLSYLVKAIGQIADKGCTFVVGGRVRQIPASTATTSDRSGSTNSSTSEFQTMETIFRDDAGAQCVFSLWPEMFVGIAETEFRSDLSSTEIRKRLLLQQQAESMKSEGK